ncbi:MAG: UDP-N-acetylmuramoyl-tripeptide--D-alanyl-D-alanine ligase [bacterium]
MAKKINLEALIKNGDFQRAGAALPVVDSVCIDSRKCKPGSLFVALPGEQTDGHRFVDDALANGAAAVMVREKQDIDCPQLIVKDTCRALQHLAAAYRAQIDSYVIGITGSCGKTTLKEILSELLTGRYTVGKTPGNYNNQLGLPLTILNEGGREVLVAEVGTNGPGEIDFLTGVLQPDMGIITHIGPSHLQGLDTVEQVAREKSALLAGLKSDGVAFIPENIRYRELLFKKSAAPVRTVGSSPAADYFVNVKRNCSGDLLETGDFSLKLPLSRYEFLLNSALAVAAARLLDVKVKTIKDVLSNFQIPAGRGRIIEVDGCRLIDDSYNANPDSMAAALRHLMRLSPPRLAVLGEMKELGASAGRLHRELGERLAELDDTEIHYVGAFAQQVAEGFGSDQINFHKDAEELSDLNLSDFSSALVKSSHAAGLYRLVEKWTDLK